MKIYTGKKTTTFVACEDNLCPRASVTGEGARVADDFKGRIRTRKGILAKIF